MFMSDNAALTINGVTIQHFKSFSVSADVYTADTSFDMSLSHPETVIHGGQRCELKINGVTEMTGLIDKPHRKWSKSQSEFNIEGRSLMGLLVDSHYDQFMDLQNISIKTLAQTLLKNVPYINTKNIIYQKDVPGSLKGRHPVMNIFSDADTSMMFSRIEPGTTIFDILKQYAMSRGMMFFGLPDGTFVFGTLKNKNAGKPSFSIVLHKDGKGNNATEADWSEDYSKRYSQVTIFNQMQGTTSQIGLPLNNSASVTDSNFPFRKIYVGQNDYGDAMTPKKYAGMVMDRQQHDAFGVTYKVPGFSQNGKNWSVNELVYIDDEVNGLKDVYLIHARTFELSKEEGAQTTLRIGLPGGLY